jgi:hypothetical protein
MADAVRHAASTMSTERSRLSEKQINAALQHMQGKRGVDILKLADAAGISVGAAKLLNEARKAHFGTQGGSGPVNRAGRIDAFLKQKWIK